MNFQIVVSVYQLCFVKGTRNVKNYSYVGVHIFQIYWNMSTRKLLFNVNVIICMNVKGFSFVSWNWTRKKSHYFFILLYTIFIIFENEFSSRYSSVIWLLYLICKNPNIVLGRDFVYTPAYKKPMHVNSKRIRFLILNSLYVYNSLIRWRQIIN